MFIMFTVHLACLILLQDLILSSQCNPHPHGMEMYLAWIHKRYEAQSAALDVKVPSWVQDEPSNRASWTKSLLVFEQSWQLFSTGGLWAVVIELLKKSKMIIVGTYI